MGHAATRRPTHLRPWCRVPRAGRAVLNDDSSWNSNTSAKTRHRNRIPVCGNGSDDDDVRGGVALRVESPRAVRCHAHDGRCAVEPECSDTRRKSTERSGTTKRRPCRPGPRRTRPVQTSGKKPHAAHGRLHQPRAGASGRAPRGGRYETVTAPTGSATAPMSICGKASSHFRQKGSCAAWMACSRWYAALSDSPRRS